MSNLKTEVLKEYLLEQGYLKKRQILEETYSEAMKKWDSGVISGVSFAYFIESWMMEQWLYRVRLN